MFESLTHTDKEDAIAIILHDHAKVKSLFDDFKNADGMRAKQLIADKVITELKMHAEIEEKIFYPAIRNEVDAKLMNEADEEHHIAKVLIAELEYADADNGHWEAKFQVLEENIRHHIGEEETDVIPQACNADIDMIAVGKQLLQMKRDLLVHGIPLCDEERLVTRRKADSPAKAAKAKSADVTPLKKKPVVKKNVKTGRQADKATHSKASSKTRRYA